MILSTQPSYCPPGASFTTSPLVGTLDSEEDNLKDENRGFLIMKLCSFLEQIEKNMSSYVRGSFLTHFFWRDIKLMLTKHRSARLQLCAFSMAG